MFKVIWEKQATEDLKKIDFAIAKKIKVRVESYLVQDPIKLGKPLRYKHQGLYRFRVADN